MPEVHHTISPSRLHRWLTCHAAFTEEKKYPDKPGGPTAVDGTHTHTLNETCVNDGLKDAMLMVGELLIDHEGAFTVDMERALRANVMLNYIKERKQQLGVCAIRAEGTCDPGKHLGWDDWKGTADCTIVSDHELEVIDYKDGRTPQDPIFNPQLMSYALGRFLEYEGVTFDRIRLTIVQPRCNPMISHHDVTPQDLMDFAEQVKAWRVIAEGPDPEFNPGEKQCKWCNAKGGCKALMNQSLNNVSMMFGSTEVANQAADKDPAQMTDDQLREFMEGIPLLKQAIAAVEEEALRRFKTGHPIPGLKAVRGRGSRGWAYDDDTMAGKLTRMGIPKSALYKTTLISPAQAEKVSWEKRDGTKHTLSKRQLDTLHKDYVKHTQGKLQIVAESDEREAVQIGAEHLFESVSTEPVTTALPDWMQL